MTDSAHTADATPAVAPQAGLPGPPENGFPPAAELPPRPSAPPPTAVPPDPESPPAMLVRPVLLPAEPIAAPIEVSDDEDSTLREVWLHMPSWLASTVLHLALVILLALVTSVRSLPDAISPLLVTTGDDASDVLGDDLESQMMEVAPALETSQALSPSQLNDLPAAQAMANAIGPISAKLGEGPPVPKLAGDADEGAVGAGSGEGNALELRLDGAGRAAMLRSGGGTPESERAVMLALAWLAEHQNSDGSWSFDHRASPKCHGKCANEGHNASKNAATAMALLPFLGTGQTHREGQYKKNIDQGLKYLVRAMQSQREGSLWDPSGTMYGHGLASIVLCEAYGMTHDQALQAPAQAAVNFIVYAQDPLGGGWRYHPQSPGDTSVVGWQLMALKSAQMAYLRVPSATMRKAGYFLDFVQGDRGAVYGYTRPESRRPATTAIGLLCRMYLGWDHDHEPLQNGVKILGQIGPSIDKTQLRNNMYYNYYATQVMHHYGGYPWQRWNAVMREYLIDSQSHNGHEAGSWFLEGSDDGSRAGGRLYCTALAAMTLEVYYRYMPLYRPQSTQTD